LQISRGGWEQLEYLEALARATGVSERFVPGFWTKFNFADESSVTLEAAGIGSSMQFDVSIFIP
jgi:hypothetical protein